MPEAVRCVYCRKRPVDPAHRPFCSARCQMADLGHWLTGDYRVADSSLPVLTPEDEESPESDPDR